MILINSGFEGKESKLIRLLHDSSLGISQHFAEPTRSHSSFCCSMHQTYRGGFYYYYYYHPTVLTMKKGNSRELKFNFFLNCSCDFRLHVCMTCVLYERRNRTSALEAYQTFSVQTPSDNGYLCPQADWVMTQQTHTHVQLARTKK